MYFHARPAEADGAVAGVVLDPPVAGGCAQSRLAAVGIIFREERRRLPERDGVVLIEAIGGVVALTVRLQSCTAVADVIIDIAKLTAIEGGGGQFSARCVREGLGEHLQNPRQGGFGREGALPRPGRGAGQEIGALRSVDEEHIAERVGEANGNVPEGLELDGFNHAIRELYRIYAI